MNHTCVVHGRTFNKRTHTQLNTGFTATLMWPTVMWKTGVGVWHAC